MATDTEAPATPAAEAAPAAAPANTGLTSAAPAAIEGDPPPEAGQGADQGTGNGEEAASGGEAQDGDQAGGGEDGSDAQGAPEEYADFALPEGYALPDDIGTELKDTAKSLNLTQDQAQKLVDLGAKQAGAILGALASDPAAAFSALGQQWGPIFSAQTQADPDIGGAKLEETMAVAVKAFNTFATPGLVQLLNETGLSHHPELIKLMAGVGKAISEDKLVTPQNGKRSGNGARVDPKSLYPNTQHQ